MGRMRAAGSLWLVFLHLMIGWSSAADISGTSVTATTDHATANVGIAPETRITMQHWREYSRFMPDGMRDLSGG